MIKKIICLSLILSFALSCFSGCGLFAELPFFALEEEVESTVSTEENGDIDEPNEPNGSNDDTSGVKYEIKEERYEVYKEFDKFYIKIYCAVENTGEVDLFLNDAKFEIFDEGDALVDTSLGVTPSLNVIQPGEIAIFYIDDFLNNAKSNEQYHVVPILNIARSKVPCIRYDVDEVELTVGAYGFPSISGKAKNNTDSDGGNVYVSVALYDKSGEFILFRRFGIFDGSFVPDRWVRFNETIVSLSSIDDVGSYKVWVCPYQYQ